MAKTQSSRIDFDYWLQLAQDDPERFETLRSETLESCIQRASDTQQVRLRCLQWRIDRIRDNTKTPLQACIRISNMMWETFNHLATGYHHLEHLQQGRHHRLPEATILPFKPHQSP
ncbi:MAG: DUF3135 domain-containing protein [Thioalkalispiraceae bacterium]|jgi:hypothetical protein